MNTDSTDKIKKSVSLRSARLGVKTIRKRSRGVILAGGMLRKPLTLF
jgi:hypothetical protein